MHRKKRSRLAVDEARHVEDRVVGLREAVQGEHAEDGGEGGEEDGRLERRHDEGRPGENGRPPMFIGYSMTEAQYCSPHPAARPKSPPARTSFGTWVSWRWSASITSSIG